jgi:hypothetical protein
MILQSRLFGVVAMPLPSLFLAVNAAGLDVLFGTFEHGFQFRISLFQSVIENVNSDVEEMLDSVPAPSHLLLLVHPFRDDLVHRGFAMICSSDNPAQCVHDDE